MIARPLARRVPCAMTLVLALAVESSWAQPGATPAPTAPGAAQPGAAQPGAPQQPGSQPGLQQPRPTQPPGAAPQPGVSAPGTAPTAAAPARVAAIPDASEFERRFAVMFASDGLTSNEAARRAVQNSLAIAAKRHALEAADASIDEASAGFWPQLLLSARYSRLSDATNEFGGGGGALVLTTEPAPEPRPLDPGEPLIAASAEFPVVLNNYALQASLNVPLSDYLLRTSRAVGAAKSSRQAAEHDERATELSVAREGRVAYYEWVRAFAQRIVSTQSVQLAQGRLQDAQVSFQAGLASRADVLRAEAGVKQAELVDERARRAAVIAELRLRVLMRDAGNEPYRVGENMLEELPALDRVLDAEAAYREALSQRPELAVLRQNQQALEQQAALARAGNFPRLDLQGNLIYANPNQRYFPQEDRWRGSWDVGVVLSWSPTDIPGAGASSRVAEARALELGVQRQALEDSLRVEVNDAIEAVKAARFALGASETALRAAEESYRVRRELYRAGRATLVEVTDAEVELTLARIEVVNARVDSRVALVVLDYALGRDTLQGQ